ncbi:MAG: peptidylprolyl isomerase [Bacteroidota bacterium]
MKTRVILLFLLIASFNLCRSQTLIDRIVAVVDREIITESELNERVNFIALQNKLDATKEDLKHQVLDAMVAEKLILAQAIIDSIEVPDDQVTQALDQQIQNITRQLGSTERVEQYYGKPINRIKREFRDEMRKQLLVQRVRQSREASLTVSRREAEEFFTTFKDSLPRVPEEFALSHIFMVPKADSSHQLQTRQKLQAILDSIRAGGKFDDFAKRHSQDGSAAGGGDLGWVKRGDFVREFEEVVFALKENEISSIVKTQYGFHIIQLIGRRGESVRARHVLLKIEKGAASDSTTVQQLRALRERILKGEPFSDLAKKYSEDEESKLLGGDLGELTVDQLAADFASVVTEMRTGEISQPHRVTLGASYGFQIIWLRKRIPSHTMNLEDDFTRVEQLALYMKKNRTNQEWVAGLKKSIFYEIRF